MLRMLSEIAFRAADIYVARVVLADQGAC